LEDSFREGEIVRRRRKGRKRKIIKVLRRNRKGKTRKILRKIVKGRKKVRMLVVIIVIMK